MFDPPKNTYTENSRNLFWIPHLKQKTVQDYIPVYWYENLPIYDKVIIYFHARNEDIETSYTFVVATADTHGILIEYPTYGVYKKVSLSETRIQEDSVCVYQFLIEKMKFLPENIIIIGRSLGCAPATYLASKKQCMFLALFSPFTSFKDVAREKMSILLSVFLKNGFNNLKHIKNVEAPVFILHGKKDKIIPYKQSQKLYQNCKNKQSQLKLPDNMNHNDFSMEVDFLAPLLLFKKSIQKSVDSQNLLKRQKTQKNEDDVQQDNVVLVKIIDLYKEKKYDDQLYISIFLQFIQCSTRLFQMTLVFVIVCADLHHLIKMYTRLDN